MPLPFVNAPYASIDSMMQAAGLTLGNLTPGDGIVSNKEIRFRANVGACLDIPTGNWRPGKYGESIMNGGVPLFMGVAGKANNFKTTFVIWVVARILFRYAMLRSSCTWYDTEETSDMIRIGTLMSRMEGFERYEGDVTAIFEERKMVVTDKSVQSGNKWWDGINDFVEAKVKQKAWEFASEFVDRHGEHIPFLLASLSSVDSISEFDDEKITKLRNDTEIGDKEAKMLYMYQGQGKDRLIREAGGVASRGNHFVFLNAQWGEDKADINAAPMSGPKPRKMNTIRPGEKIRGVPDSYLYLPQHVWLINGSKNLRDDANTNAEFPLDFDSTIENLDLWCCPMSMIRSKTGLSAITNDLIVSQKRGVQPTLTEFYNIFRKKKRYGINGSGQYYTMDLYPDLKLQRTEVRKRIDTDPLLRRAINITSEISQIGDFDTEWSSKIPPMAELRKKLVSDGYDMNTLLETREWFTFNVFRPFHNPFLSSMDLLKMFYNEYEPYWLEKDKKTIRKEFAKMAL